VAWLLLIISLVLLVGLIWDHDTTSVYKGEVDE